MQIFVCTLDKFAKNFLYILGKFAAPLGPPAAALASQLQ